MKEIPGYASFSYIKPINAGLSADKKYYIESFDSQLLLRIADISKYDRKKVEFLMMKRVAELGVPMSKPVGFGVCDEGKSVYTLLTWCEGTDVETLLPTCTKREQYVLGVDSGRILRRIHSILPEEKLDDWPLRFFETNNNRLIAYQKCGVGFEEDRLIFDYLMKNKHLLKDRPQCFMHGDYHIGNMILDENKVMSVIDWNHADFDNWGDPWEEFARVAAGYSYFATGQINGYFDNNVPAEFWNLLMFYIAASAITAIPWATNYGQKMMNSKIKLCRNVLRWFDNMNNPIPTWYIRDLDAE